MRIVDGRLSVSASDTANFLACRHLTRLDLAAAHELIETPHLQDVGFDALVQRGEQHESEVLEGFLGRGWEVRTVPDPFEDFDRSVAETTAALADDADVIYQGALVYKDRRGHPDFLVRAGLLGGSAGYEVVEAKLARTAKARAVLQATFYSRLLAQTTGIDPERMQLALGGGQLVPFEIAAYAAYERQVDRLLANFTTDEPRFPPADTYPEPVEHCPICRWRVHCMARRRADDDLSLIAGITSRQRKVLKESGMSTRRGIAGLEALPVLPGVGTTSLAKVHAQARIQVEGEDAGEPRFELIEPERDEEGGLVPDRGLLALPPPAEGDLFFDIEGARYYSGDGQEFGLRYLFGIVNTADRDGDGSPRYRAIWAFDRASERAAFEQLMDFLAAHLARYPNAHIYHYNHYEPTSLDHLSELHVGHDDALRRLMGRFASREDDLDELLRRRIFVDLYRVVRQGVRVSVESYSLKRLEPFVGFDRAVPLDEVNERMVTFEIALDDGTASDDTATQNLIAGYNEDDCRATLRLRDWLEQRRDDLAQEVGHDLPRPEPPVIDEESTSPEIAELRETLLDALPDDDEPGTPEQRAHALMADLLEYHRREDKPAWWRHFHLLTLTDEELIEQPDAIARLEFEGDIGPVKRSRRFRYRFPAQEHGFSDGDKAVDPLTEAKWELIEVDDAEGYLDIRRGRTKVDEPHPTSLIKPGPEFSTTTHRESIKALAHRVIEAGHSRWARDCAFDLLLRRRPNTDGHSGEALRHDEESALEAGCRLALNLDRSYLPVQGPPGTGKTHLGANQIVDLVLTRPRIKIGVTAMSHAVIFNMLNEVAKVAADRGEAAAVRIGQRPDPDGEWVSPAAEAGGLVFGSPQLALDALTEGEVDVVGGTTWLWTRPEAEQALDVLVVDEAGQMSMADVLAASRSARNLILLGDPLQLPNPSQGSHPPTVPASALEHALAGLATIGDDRGLFIDQTRRMHPDITAFTSEVFYDGRLRWIEGLNRQAVLCDGPFWGSGLRVVSVDHKGNSNASPEEAASVASIIVRLLGCGWRDARGEEHAMTKDDVLVVTPFNAQIREIRNALEESALGGVRVGTVDKFQGRQAPVVVYSMTSSSADDAPRGIDFLYDLHRLNVATSRAQAMAIILANPDLVRAFCRTPRQMQLVGALCRLLELAKAAE